MATTAEEEEEETIYFRVYRSISFFTGFVEYQEQGLHQQGEKKLTMRTSASQIYRETSRC
jgi:hypothetical protein